MEYKVFIKIAISITIFCCIIIIIFNSLTTPTLVAPEVDIIMSETTSTDVKPDTTPEIQWSDGQTSNSNEDTTSAPVNKDMWWDINTVTKEQLCQIPGIGEKTAQKILNYRETITEYYDISELTEIKGIGVKTLEKLKQYLYVKD